MCERKDTTDIIPAATDAYREAAHAAIAATAHDPNAGGTPVTFCRSCCDSYSGDMCPRCGRRREE